MAKKLTLALVFAALILSFNLVFAAPSPIVDLAPYDSNYFAMTPGNINDSACDPFYASWAAKARFENETAFKEFGEVGLFGKTFLQDDDYHCGIGWGGCTNRHSWQTIFKLYPDNPELARKVYFSHRKQLALNLILKVISDGTAAALERASEHVGEIIVRCTQQENTNVQEQCNAIKGVIKAVITVITDIVIILAGGPAGVGQFTGEKFDITSGPFKGQTWPKVTTDMGVLVVRAFTAQPMDYVLNDEIICSGIGIDFKANNPEHERKLRALLSNSGAEYRKLLSSKSRELNRGFFPSDQHGTSSLSDLMSAGVWSDERVVQETLDDPFVIENEIFNQIMHGLTAAAWRSTGCYIKCSTRADAQELCSNRKNDIYRSRYCPKPNKVCQVQCWKQQHHGSEVELYGLQELHTAPFFLNITEEFHKMWKYYELNGDQLPSGLGLSADFSFGGGIPALLLVVCDSETDSMPITNFKKQLWPNGWRRNKMFPTSCGNWQGNETKSFMKHMDLDHGSKRFKDGHLRHLYRHTIPRSIHHSKKLPLNNFLDYCRNDIMYPEWGQLCEVQFKPSSFCEPILNEISGMEQIEANRFFCDQSDTAKRLFKKQQSLIVVTGGVSILNHKSKCSRWNRLRDKRGEDEGDELEDTEESLGIDFSFEGTEEMEQSTWV